MQSIVAQAWAWGGSCSLLARGTALAAGSVQMPSLFTRISVVLAAALLAGVATAAAQPLDLDDPTPRAIIVRFEISPRSAPAMLDRRYGPPLPARLESAGADLVRVVIDSSIVEQHVFGEDQPVPGSFGDFVWLFDTRSGHVLDARFEGRIVQLLDWGLVRFTTEARVRARMSTRERAGFEPPRRVLGNRVFRHCDPDNTASSSCRSVEAVRFDPARGYVNAVGVLEAQTPLGVGAETFSPLGEAIFLEVGTPIIDAGAMIVDAGEIEQQRAE